MYRHLLAPFMAMLPVACATTGDTGPASTFFYECDDQSSFVARIEGSHAWLFLDHVTINLPRLPSASGVKYKGAEHLFLSRGDDAWLEIAGGDSVKCKNNRSKAVWESAKLDGVEFRAIGNEPGWSLLLGSDLLVLDIDYGANRYEFNMPEPDIDVEARLTRYQVSESGQEFLLELQGQPCQDSMSGESFPTRVSIRLNGREFHGCGRSLY